jgi:hypothetical protein
MPNAFQFEHGQTVRIAASASPPLKPGTEVAVVGMTRLSRDREILNVMCAAGSDVYLIEFADGKSLEVPENFLELSK